jgi:hypothetical protein
MNSFARRDTGVPDGPHPNSSESGLRRAFAIQSLASFAPPGTSGCPENVKRTCERTARGVNSRRRPALLRRPPAGPFAGGRQSRRPFGQGAGRKRRSSDRTPRGPVLSTSRSTARRSVVPPDPSALNCGCSYGARAGRIVLTTPRWRYPPTIRERPPLAGGDSPAVLKPPAIISRSRRSRPRTKLLGRAASRSSVRPPLAPVGLRSTAIRAVGSSSGWAAVRSSN